MELSYIMIKHNYYKTYSKTNPDEDLLFLLAYVGAKMEAWAPRSGYGPSFANSIATSFGSNKLTHVKLRICSLYILPCCLMRSIRLAYTWSTRYGPTDKKARKCIYRLSTIHKQTHILSITCLLYSTCKLYATYINRMVIQRYVNFTYTPYTDM